jgi:hypothetical protein
MKANKSVEEVSVKKREKILQPFVTKFVQHFVRVAGGGGIGNTFISQYVFITRTIHIKSMNITALLTLYVLRRYSNPGLLVSNQGLRFIRLMRWWPLRHAAMQDSKTYIANVKKVNIFLRDSMLQEYN